MPTASVTLDRDSQGSQEALDPIHKVSNLLEKKIRNLEKRKNKLEQYRQALDEGKDLIEDQRQAVASFDCVISNLELMRDMSNHVTSVIAEHNKLLKKQMKKDAVEKQNEEIARIREILKVQDVLQLMGQDEVRADFLAGTNGAVVMPPENLEYLDNLFKLVTPSREECQEVQDFQKELKKAAEHMAFLLEARNSEVAGTTYKTLMNIIDEISSCSYPEVKEPEVTEEEETVVEPILEDVPEYTNGIVGEEPEELAQVAESVATLASDCPPPGLPTSPTVVPLQSPSVPQEKPSLVSSAQDVLAAAMAQIPTATVPGAPPQAPGMPPAPSFFTQPEPHQPPPPQVPQPAPPQQTPVPPPVQPQVQPPVQPPVQPTLQPPVQPPVQAPVQPSLQQISLNDLVSPGSFDFLQESQVAQEPPTVYMDPAVVSIGSIKTDSVSQKILSPVQQPPQSVNPVVSLAQEHTHPSNIPSQTFTNQTYNNLNVTNYSQGVGTVYPPSNTEVETTPNPPPSLSLPSQTRTQSAVEFNPEARPWTSDQSTPSQESITPSTTICQSHDDSNWGSPDIPVNGGDDKWANEANSWDEYEDTQIGSGSGSGVHSNNGHNDFDRRGGFRGNRRGGFVPRGGGFRGGRGGNGNGGGYQNGRGGYGGGGYGGGYRGGRGGGMNGPRGGRGFRGGQGPRGGFRGRGGQRAPYQQQQHMMQ